MKNQDIRRLEAMFSHQTPDQDLDAETRRVRALGQLIQAAVEEGSERSVRPFLAERVLRRLEPSAASTEVFLGTLWQLFRPMGIAALFLILALAAYSSSLVDAYDVRPTTSEALLGLQPVTLTTAYATDVEPLEYVDP